MTNTTHTKTIDLTGPFIVWLVVWSLIGFAIDWPSWVVVTAIAPIALWFMFIFLIFGVGILAMGSAYLGGQRIKFTRGNKVTYYQRGHKPFREWK